MAPSGRLPSDCEMPVGSRCVGIFTAANDLSIRSLILCLHQLFSSRQEPTFVMASQLKLFLPANYTTHLLSSTHATNECIVVLEVWLIFPFAIKRILGIKRIFTCNFENKRMHLLTRVYSSPTTCLLH